jgi:predicted nucleotidyltransferase
MESSIPVSLQPCIDAYLHALAPWHARFVGIYLHGSIALGAFEEGESDIDVLVLTRGEWSAEEMKRFATIHAQLVQRQSLCKLMDVAYIPLQERAPSAIFRDGTFATPARLDATMAWITKHQGIRLLGQESATLPLDVTWDDVLEAMRFNLDGYWAGKARQAYLFWFDYWVMTSVATLCRILSAIEEGEIIAKSAALQRWRERFPPRWQLLLDEAWRIRHHPEQPSLYRNRIRRKRETLAFLAYARARGGKALQIMKESFQKQ